MRSAQLSWIIPWWILLSGWLSTHVMQCHPSPPVPDVASSSSSSLGGAAASSGSQWDDLEILAYHIQSVVISRYAVTTVTCKIRNPTLDSREAAFTFLLPVNAFISNLTIEAGGKNYTSLVREKEEARRTYEKAKSQGRNTAIVHQKERETSKFRVDVSVAEQDEVIFYLTYEELLERRLGVYSHKINVHPGYPVRDLLVDVTIHETRDINVVEVKKVPGGPLFRDAVATWREGLKTARLRFHPNHEGIPADGVLHGQLEVQYDVMRALDAGDVQVVDGYFVHFFAPSDLQYTPKHITFLIDVSGSMHGNKLMQVKEALQHILTELNQGDTFNIIRFSAITHKLGTMRYTGTAVRKARKYINSLEVEGGTNIDGGLKDAMEQDIESTVSDSVRPHIIVMLTDGQPTVGVTSENILLRNVRERNKEKATIFCLGFGPGADMELLEKISLQNHGSARKIYEDSDAADQLKGFYQELSSPILLDVDFSYSTDAVVVNSLSNTHFYNYFSGTELVVTGQTHSTQQSIKANITGQGRNGEFFMGVSEWNNVVPPDHHLLNHLHLAPTPKNFIKRLWAFLKIKNLLNEEKAARGVHEKASAQKKALSIALENHFVTPLTSLVVVQPDGENCKDYEEDDEDEEESMRRKPLPSNAADNTSFLNFQDSVAQGFNPATIQIRGGLLTSEYDYDEHAMDHNNMRLAEGNYMSSASRISSNSLCVLPLLVLLLQLLNQITTAQVHSTVK
ncbi:hypothetical protein O3P69_003721 [Scylla paramamosain]|uniref:Inter-alpha-trypsin inhibitor heavy chain H3 n=1 Tax=Scylla paramamosain TaxID=85552 RepID=A0AAW0UCZ1_SCYPA